MHNRRRFFRIPADELTVMFRKKGSRSWTRVSAVDYTRNGLGIVAGEISLIPGEHIEIYLASKDESKRPKTKVRKLKSKVANVSEHDGFQRYGIKFVDRRATKGRTVHMRLCRIESEISQTPKSESEITDVVAYSQESMFLEEAIVEEPIP